MSALALVAALALAAPEEPSLGSRFSLGARAVGALSLTPARTQGGLGGGVSLAFALTPHWQLQGDVVWLGGIGSSGLVRLGGGWHRLGVWQPLLRLDLELGVGQALEFGTSARPPVRTPTLGLTLSAALLRFQLGRFVLSGLEVSGGVATELVSVGPRFSVTLLAVSVSFGE